MGTDGNSTRKDFYTLWCTHCVTCGMRAACKYRCTRRLNMATLDEQGQSSNGELSPLLTTPTTSSGDNYSCSMLRLILCCVLH